MKSMQLKLKIILFVPVHFQQCWSTRKCLHPGMIGKHHCKIIAKTSSTSYKYITCVNQGSFLQLIPRKLKIILHTIYICKEGGDIGLFIALVPKVFYNVFLFVSSTTLRTILNFDCLGH